MDETKPNLDKLRYIIQTDDNASTKTGTLVHFWDQGKGPPPNFIFLPQGEPLETIREKHPKLYEVLVECNWTHFPDLRWRPLEPGHQLIPSRDKRYEEIQDALEYYSHPDHYEESHRLCGIRPPGVLVERGGKARRALGLFRTLMRENGVG